MHSHNILNMPCFDNDDDNGDASCDADDSDNDDDDDKASPCAAKKLWAARPASQPTKHPEQALICIVIVIRNFCYLL